MTERAGTLADRGWPDLDGTAPTVLLPLGSCEQHGPHLPLDTDAAVAAEVARRAARPPEVLVAPAQRYGASGEHEGFPGTVSIGHAALRLLILELGRSACRWAGRLLVVNGHGGNVAGLASAVRRLRYEGRDVAWWPCAPAEPADAHAGRAETSMMLALRPAAVRTDRAVAGPTAPLAELLPRLATESVAGVSASGVLGDPAGASANEGERLLAGMADRLAAALRDWTVTADGVLADPARVQA